MYSEFSDFPSRSFIGMSGFFYYGLVFKIVQFSKLNGPTSSLFVAAVLSVSSLNFLVIILHSDFELISRKKYVTCRIRNMSVVPFIYHHLMHSTNNNLSVFSGVSNCRSIRTICTQPDSV